MWKNEQFKVRVEEDAVKGFEKIMLTSQSCGLFMPMCFTEENSMAYIKYNCSGFAPLSMYRIERTDDALFILESVLLILSKAVEYFITPEKIMVTEDTVFYNKETGQVRIAYVPTGKTERELKKGLLSFIGQIKGGICDGREYYMAEAARYIYFHNYSLREMVNKTGELRRCAYDESLRKELESA